MRRVLTPIKRFSILKLLLARWFLDSPESRRIIPLCIQTAQPIAAEK
jgi:hypothetical protein